MRSRMAAITRPACASGRSAQLPRWSGDSTSTSWMPLPGAWVNAGPRWETTIGASPEKAGNRLGTTRTCQLPPGPYASRAGGVASSWPAQNGHGRDGSASTGMALGRNANGRSARSVLITTQRPVSGSRRSWLTGAARQRRDALEDTVASPPHHVGGNAGGSDVTDDRVRPSRRRAEQDRAIGAYLRLQVAPYSPFYRPRYAQAGVDAGQIRATADLAKLPLTSLDEVDDPASLVLR